jgi:hypothetical protein
MQGVCHGGWRTRFGGQITANRDSAAARCCALGDQNPTISADARVEDWRTGEYVASSLAAPPNLFADPMRIYEIDRWPRSLNSHLMNSPDH